MKRLSLSYRIKEIITCEIIRFLNSLTLHERRNIVHIKCSIEI